MLKRLNWSKTFEQKKREEKGKFKKVRFLKGHLEKIQKAKKQRVTKHTQNLNFEKVEYLKVCLSGFPLLVSLFLLVAIACWITKSFLIFTFSVVSYGILLKLYRKQRMIPAYKIFDRNFAGLAMSICRIFAIAITAILIIFALTLK